MAYPRMLASLGVAALVAATLAGCGSDDAKALTKAQFIKKADAICTAANKKAEEIGATLSDSSSEADVEKAIDKVVTHYEDEIADLKELDPPASAADDVDELLASLSSGVKEIKDQGAAVLQSGENPLADASEKAKAFGLEKCGSGS